eukprot:1568459-Prorocentrum_lima.AAC.1
MSQQSRNITRNNRSLKTHGKLADVNRFANTRHLHRLVRGLRSLCGAFDTDGPVQHASFNLHASLCHALYPLRANQ